MNSWPFFFRSPAAGDREVPCVEDGEPAGQIAVGIAEHRHRDDVTGHAMDRVRCTEPDLLLDLLALDHVDPRRERGSLTSTRCSREDRIPGTIMVSRDSWEWHAEEHPFQPK